MSAVVLKPHERARGRWRRLRPAKLDRSPPSFVRSILPSSVHCHSGGEFSSLFLQHYPTSPNNSSPPTSRQVWIFYCPSWPQQCSPLSTVFDLIKAADEEHAALGGPILALDR